MKPVRVKVKKCKKVRKVKCENKCEKKCKLVKRKCRFYKIFNFPKFCPFLLVVKSTIIRGTAKKPADVVIPNKKVVKKTNTKVIKH